MGPPDYTHLGRTDGRTDGWAAILLLPFVVRSWTIASSVVRPLSPMSNTFLPSRLLSSYFPIPPHSLLLCMDAIFDDTRWQGVVLRSTLERITLHRRKMISTLAWFKEHSRLSVVRL